MNASSVALGVLMSLGGLSAVHAAAVVEGDDQVVASRGGASLTMAEIDARVMELPAHLRAEYLNSPVRIEETIGAMLLEKQLATAAYELGAGEDPYLPMQLEQAQTRFLATRARKLSEETLVIPDFTELAEETYLANPDKYSTPETIEVTHVLISEKGRSEEAALARAKEVRAKALLPGADFSALVQEYTDERPRGVAASGKVSKLVRGMTEPPFENAAFDLKNPGDISEVVKTNYGYHVIQLNERAPAVKLAYDQVQAKILDDLRKNFVDKNKSGLSDKLRSLKIDASPELVASLRDRYTIDGPKGERVAGKAKGGDVSAAASSPASGQ